MMTFIEQQDEHAVALIRIGAGSEMEQQDASDLVSCAQKKGRRRLRRRRTLATVLMGACVTTAVFALMNLGPRQDIIQPADVPTASLAGDGFQMPALQSRADDAADLPGDDGYDWRGQIRQAVATYPGRLIMPSSLPPQTAWLQAATHGGLATLDVFGEGPGIIICSGNAIACSDALPGWESIHEGRVDVQDFVVLVSPSTGTDASGLSSQQRAYWQGADYQNEVPPYLSSPAES